MYGIVAFFKRYYYSLLFIALEVISFLFVVNYNYYQEAGFFNSSNRVAGAVYGTYSDITSYFGLKSMNRQLAEENLRLLNLASQLNDTATHKKISATNNYGQQYHYILAQVIDNSTNLPNNYITLNGGSEQGISEGMGVIGPDGIVGIVVKVSAHYTVVMSLLHQKTLVSAMIKKSGTFGTLSWGDKMDYRYAKLSQIPMSEKMKLGDTIITSGYSSMFPKGIMVGTVDDFKAMPELYFYAIRVKLSTDFKNLKYVYIVSDMEKVEKEEIEKEAKASINDNKK